MTSLILLPGMMCDARLFGPQVAALPGTVMSFAVDETSVEGMAKRLLAQTPERFALAGLSMGGIVAMEMLRQAPQRIERLALLDTNPLAERDGIKARRAAQIAKARDGELSAVMRDEMKPNYLTDGPNRQAILDLCMDMALLMGPQAFENQSIALRDRRDQTETLRGFAGPALVLCGREDTLCPVKRHTLMHALMPQSTLTVIDGAGHLPTLEQPEKTTAALRTWLKETHNG